MPYSGASDASLPDHVKAMPDKKRRQWVAVWNSVYQRCISDGGDVKSCENKAFPQANGVVKMALETETLPGVDILRVGEGFKGVGCPPEGCTLTSDDLDNMVSAYWATREARQPPIALGHDENQTLLQKDGYPAVGVVANLRRLGDRLYADFLDVPAKLAELIKAGAYRTLSSEYAEDFEVDGQKYPRILTRLALLGADIPAVDGLNSISKLYQSLQLELDATTQAVVMERERPPVKLAVWDTSYINNLPDSAFAYIADGGQKDSSGKTTPRSLRYLPHHEASGGIDMPHLRNALSRAPQTNLSSAAKAQAIRHLQGHAKSAGVGSSSP